MRQALSIHELYHCPTESEIKAPLPGFQLSSSYTIMSSYFDQKKTIFVENRRNIPLSSGQLDYTRDP